jgi:hypothetical protein
MNKLWQEQAKVLGGPDLLQVLLEVRDNQQKMIERFERNEDAIERVLSGFPADDVDGHRRYHQSVIERRELVNKMLRETLVNVAKTGTLGALGWLLLAAWKYFQISVAR